MRFLDGELEPERARAVEAALEESTELRREYVLFSRMKDDLHDLGASMEAERTVWGAVNRRLTRPLGWLLFLVGAAAWVGYGVYTYLTGGTAIWEKLAASAVVVGLAMLLLSVMIERIRDLKTDPYREIQR